MTRIQAPKVWAHPFRLPTTFRGFACDVIVASETRSDGPWSADFGDDTIDIEGNCNDFVISRRDRNDRRIRSFAAKDHAMYVDANYYSFRLHGGIIFVILDDAKNHLPFNAAKPLRVKPNPVNYQITVIDILTGNCELEPFT